MKIDFFFLFQLNAHNMLNTYIYHLLPPTCFGVCYTFFRETIALLIQELYAFCNVVTQVLLHNIKYTLMFKTYSACYSVQNNMWFVLLYLKDLKRYLKSLLQHINICWFLLFIVYVGNICMFTVSSCVWVSSGVEILRGPCSPRVQ
jgi:hypothetical protein